MTDDNVDACPYCDSTSLNTSSGHLIRCTDCGRKFETPTRRPRQNNTTPGQKGAAKLLADAAPDDWP